MEFQKDELNEILNIFQQESSEIISSMDEKLLVLEKEGKNLDIAIQLFRDAHSLKGSARMLGFEDIQNVAHKIEDLISLIKEDKIILNQSITDTISECLEFISMLIDKTVAQKEEFKSPDINLYIQKLENVQKEAQQEFEFQIKNSEVSEEKAKFLKAFPQIEKLILDILHIISCARKNKDYSDIYSIEDLSNKFSLIINEINNEPLNSLKNIIENLITSLEKFKNSDNKELSFLDVNKDANLFIENLINYIDKEHIERKNYYEIIDKMLFDDSINNENIITSKNEKFEELLAKIPLLSLNMDFYPEVNELIYSQQNIQNTPDELKHIYKQIKEIIDLYKKKNTTLPNDVANGLKEVVAAFKTEDNNAINEAKIKINLIKTMSEFQNTRQATKQIRKNSSEISQKDILNTITNTEIKTLKVESTKLDNLVGQIGELIISKIKTNEQLSLAKNINSELIDWQKNFLKMNYYIKYFDKKYLSNPILDESHDYQKVAAYNKQLCTLCDQHNEKISNIIKDVSILFKQLQESESKLNSTSSEIENMVKNMRILPLSTIFQLFPRMVHNIARDKNKKIDLVIEGSDITADKTIIEEIKIPLMHIIRNSIDHGIEDVETRKELGKNPTGKIIIRANYQDNKIIIDIQDDGKGLDIEKIKQKALEKKILTEEEIKSIGDEELTNLIFYPGFSTEDFVTELSGRGLGLDIVNNKIAELQGRIDIYSQINQGTLVKIILPATVATRKVFIIKEQKQLYAIDTSIIKTITRINLDEIFEKNGKNYCIYNNEAIVVYTLSQILNLKNNCYDKNKYTLLIIKTESITFGIIIEKLISDQEIVHKKLEPPLYKVKHISGITTLANGEACLILSVSDIINTITSKKIKTKVVYKNDLIKNQDNSKYTVLIVDDSYTTRILQKNILSNNGYNVVMTTTPKHALDKLKQMKIDLIITDIEMPEMNGFEFIQELKQSKDYADIPVIVVTSEPIEQNKNKIQNLNIAKYIQKSLFKQEELLSAIENELK